VASAGAEAPSSASITAKDSYSFDNGSGGNSVSIAKDGTVTFSYPTGGSYHNVVFDGGKDCPELPADPAGAPWSGSCTSVTTPAGPPSIAVTALAAKGVLASRARLVKVGSVKKRSTGTGRTSFALRVSRSARRALARRHRLSVTLRVAVAPDAGDPFRMTLKVVLRERS
jgi:hypothetical protein